MAATVSNLGRGNYVLGGLGAVRGPSAADAMVENQQEARAAREAELLAQQRRQQMQLAQSEEARAQATFAQQQEAYRRQQAARAQAEAQRAAQQRAFAEFTQSLQEQPAGLTIPTAFPVGAPPPTGMQLPPPTFDALPQVPDTPEDEAYRFQRRGPAPVPGVRPVARPERPVAPVPGVEPLSMGFSPIGPAGTPGVQVASLDPMESFRVAVADLSGGAGTRVADLSGGAGTQVADLSGGAGVDTLSPAEGPSIRAVNPQASALVQDVQELARQGDIARALSRIQVGLTTGIYGPTSNLIGRAVGYAFDSPEEAALRTAAREAAQWFNDRANRRYFFENPDLLVEAAADPISFMSRVGELPAPETSAPPAPEPEVAGMFEAPDQLVTPEGDSIAGLTLTDRRDPVAGTEAAARAAPQRDISQYFMSNPNLTLDLHMQLARERQMLEARLRYAEATQNISLYEQTFSSLNSRERVVNENLIEGQIAILAAQQDNFGPLQEFMDRARPNDNVELIPYTNGTVAFFVNGQEDGEPIPVADLLEGLARTFNTEYREALAAAAAQEAEREQFLFENALIQQLQAAREISVAQAKALAEMEVLYGRVDPVGDLPSGDKLFQVFTPERGYVQFRIVEAGQPLVNGQPAPAATVEEVPQVSPLR